MMIMINYAEQWLQTGTLLPNWSLVAIACLFACLYVNLGRNLFKVLLLTQQDQMRHVKRGMRGEIHGYSTLLTIFILTWPLFFAYGWLAKFGTDDSQHQS